VTEGLGVAPLKIEERRFSSASICRRRRIASSSSLTDGNSGIALILQISILFLLTYIERAFADLAFHFHKRSQLFIRVHNETLSVAAMRVSNPDCSPVGIKG